MLIVLKHVKLLSDQEISQGEIWGSLICVTGDLSVLGCDCVTFRMAVVDSSSKLDSPIATKGKSITMFRKDWNKLNNDTTS